MPLRLDASDADFADAFAALVDARRAAVVAVVVALRERRQRERRKRRYCEYFLHGAVPFCDWEETCFPLERRSGAEVHPEM